MHFFAIIKIGYTPTVCFTYIIIIESICKYIAPRHPLICQWDPVYNILDSAALESQRHVRCVSLFILVSICNHSNPHRVGSTPGRGKNVHVGKSSSELLSVCGSTHGSTHEMKWTDRTSFLFRAYIVRISFVNEMKWFFTENLVCICLNIIESIHLFQLI